RPARDQANPPFREEMLSGLLDAGFVTFNAGRWLVSQDPASLPLPVNIRSVLAARLEALDPDERAILERASEMGEVFYWGAVTALSPEDERSTVGSRLISLSRKGFIRATPSYFPREDAYRFHPLLVRDAAYDSLVKKERAEVHQRFADWIERAAGDRADEFEELV